MRPDDVDMAMLLEALAARSDPMTRFVESLPKDLRFFAEETIRLRQQFEVNVMRVLRGSDPRESAMGAAWITENVCEVAYRWSALLKSLTRWCEIDTESINFRFRGGGG